jgi:uncharacterized protein (DUF433 family)
MGGTPGIDVMEGVMDRIVSDVEVCGGEPCVKGTRIPVWVVLSHLAAGESEAVVLKEFPTLGGEDIQACLTYASYLARERAA